MVFLFVIFATAVLLATLQSLEGRASSLKTRFGSSLVNRGENEGDNVVLNDSILLRGGFSSDNLFDVSSVEEFEKILESAAAEGKLVVVDFYAEWCMPCKIIAPVYVEMSESERFAEAVFVKVDIEVVPAIAEKYEITSMPTFVFIKEGAVVNRFSGASVEKLADTISNLL